MRKLAMLLGVVLAVSMFGIAWAQDSVIVNLDAINNTGISGTAVFTPQGNQTLVVVTLKGAPAGASEPIHIHTGQCGANLGGVKYPLKNVENGTSTTVIDAPFIPLWTGGFAINAHESAANIKNYVACGNLPTMSAATIIPSPNTPSPKAGGIPLEGVILVAGILIGAGQALRRRAA